ncbi:MAG: PIN domain-containing protein, partial [Armatimonadota bacterium]|nr:PIN domain-containing protein [Armatimonadota bacterium]
MVSRLSKGILVVLVFTGGILGKAVGDLYLEIPTVRGLVGESPSQRISATLLFVALGALICGALSRVANRQLKLLSENMESLSTTEKLGMISGLVVGVLIATIATLPLLISSSLNDLTRWAIWLLVSLTCAYLGARVFLSMKEDIFLIWPSQAALAKLQNKGTEETTASKQRIKILDTNVIIDGRIADIVRTGFIEGPVYIPGCVLDELHHIADSPDQLKRARGRRGLDILNQLHKDMKLLVRTYDHLLPANSESEVDQRLVQVAKQINGVIITNDFNLNKVAEVEGVRVLNVNELANAMKPVVLPGEEMTVTVIREGKEPNQGVAYLEDGTMVVVEGGRRRINETLTVVVTSVLQ